VTILLAAGLSFYSSDSNATHSMGADLTYECIGPDTYKLRLSFYRDCFGIDAPLSVSIDVSSISCGEYIYVTAYPIVGTGQEITPICPTDSSTCKGGVFTGIEEWIYEGTVVLPAQCTDWTFSYLLCCRNGAITTINTPLSQNIYIYSTLNNVAVACNNSPTFTNKPVPFVCLGQEFCFNHGAYDTDGDSLVYSLITPLSDAGFPVVYLSPYSNSQPLNSVPPMSFDPATGDFCITPQLIEVTVMAVLVSEYRNGVLIGEVERDMQITVIPCTNILPSLTGIDSTGSFAATICADAPYCFDIFSSDTDTGQTISMTWDQSIPAGTFTTAGTPHPVSTFCWTPGQADVSSTPHCFTVRVVDDACPLFGSQVFSYCLTVVNLAVDAGPDQSVSCSGTTTLNAVAAGGSGTVSYLWSTGETTSSVQAGAGTYTVTVTNGLCTASDAVNVTQLSGPLSAFSATTGCMNDPVTFTDLSTVTSGTITGWSLTFGDGSVSALQNPSHLYASPGTYSICLAVISGGCTDTVCQDITVQEDPVSQFTASNACEGMPVTFNNGSSGNISSYNWNFGNGNTSSQVSPSATYAGYGSYTVTLVVADPSGCSDTSTQQVVIHQLPLPSFITSGGACQGGQVAFTSTSQGNITAWSWDFGNGQTSSLENPLFAFGATGTFPVTLSVITSQGCTASVTQQVNSAPVVTPQVTPPQSVCPGSQASMMASGGVVYLWSTGSTSPSLQVSPGSTTTYTVTVTDGNGCTATAQTSVTILPEPVLLPDPDAHICKGSSETISVTGASVYSWQPGGQTTASITVSPVVNTVYTVTGTDALGCSSSASVQVFIHDTPVVNIPGALVCAGSIATLDAGNTGSSYIWSSGESTQTVVTGQPGTYTVTVTNSWGCSSSGTVLVSSGGNIGGNSTAVAFCAGGSSVLNAGNPGSTYLWNPGGQTTQLITVSAGGAYSVVITNVNGCTGSRTFSVTVNPLPQVSFSGTDICLGDTVFFSNGTPGTNMYWSWSFGDGTYSNIKQPAHAYGQPGIYNVALQVTSDAGCADSASGTVEVYAPPVADAGLPQSVCSNIQATLIASGGISYLWSDGSTLQTFSFLPLSSSSYTVTVTDINGCTASDFTGITMLPAPVASAGPQAVICLGDSSTLTGSGNGSYLWQPGNYTAGTITVTPSNTTWYTLVVTAGNGCSSEDSVKVKINALPVADAGPDTSVCTGSQVTLSVSGGSSYHWLPGGYITASVTVSPVTFTSYTVVVTNAQGCTGSDTVDVMSYPLPAVITINPVICTGQSAMLDAGNPGSLYMWSTGATDQAIQAASSGSYTVTVTAAGGCTESGTFQVTLGGGNIASNASSVSVCQGTPAVFDAGNAGSSFLWSTGATTQQIHVSSAGPYTVTVTDLTGCSAAFVSSLGYHPDPVASFTAAPACQGSPVSFVNTTTISGGTVSAWHWDFGNGQTSQSASPQHIFSQPGSVPVTLTAVSSVGCTSSASGTVMIHNLPVAAFSSQSSCFYDTAFFYDLSYVTNDSLTAWTWNFGDNTTHLGPSASHVYGSAGLWTPMLTVTTAHGCTDTVSATYQALPAPVAVFSATDVCMGSPVQFTDSSHIAGSLITGWSWTFGNGGTSQVKQPSHIYAAPGSFTVTLIASSADGCLDTTTAAVQVHPLPVTDFSATVACDGQAIQLTNLSAVAGGGTLSYSWDLGDGNSSSLPSPSHIYPHHGIFNVTLEATSIHGCITTLTKQVHVHPRPVVSFSMQDVCDGQPVIFSNSSTIASGQISSWNWNMGDNSTDTLFAPVHLYAGTGSYAVTLGAISDQGCMSVAADTVIVYAVPQPLISLQGACVGAVVMISDVSNTTASGTSGWLWNLGDGTYSTGQAVMHQYVNPGSYTVTLTASTPHGCSATVSATQMIHPNPVSGFSVKGSCEGTPIQFMNSSYISAGTITQFEWDFGDSTPVSILTNPVHSYVNAGYYSVTLKATSSLGCKDTAESGIHINSNPVPLFSATTPEGCGPLTVNFYDSSFVDGSYINKWHWSFGDGNTAGIPDPVHTYTKTGSYPVTLTVTSFEGCMATVVRPGFITVHPDPVASFTLSPHETNVLDHITFENFSQGATSYLWDFGDGGSSTEMNTYHTYSDTGTYTVTLTSINEYGCKHSVRETVHMNPVWTIYIPNAFTPNDDGVNDIFSPNGIGIISYTVIIWNRWGDMVFEGKNCGWNGAASNRQSPAIQDVYIYQVKFTDVFGGNHQETGRVTLLK